MVAPFLSVLCVSVVNAHNFHFLTQRSQRYAENAELILRHHYQASAGVERRDLLLS